MTKEPPKPDNEGCGWTASRNTGKRWTASGSSLLGSVKFKVSMLLVAIGMSRNSFREILGVAEGMRGDTE
jgi:hypothetical protein